MLETRWQELSNTLGKRQNIAVERAPDALDDLEHAGERNLAMWSLEKHFAQLRFVEAALDRIAAGTYGCCLQCDEEIGMKRMTAPHAVFLHHVPGKCGAERITMARRLEGTGRHSDWHLKNVMAWA